MNGKDIELTRRRVLGGVATIGAASAAAGAGTFAYFSDTEASTGNTVTAGVLDLTGDTGGSIAVTEAVPGDSIPSSGTTTLQSTYETASTVDPAEVDFSVALTEPGNEPTEPTDSTDQTAAAFGQQLLVDTANLTVNGSAVDDLTSSQGVSTVADLDGLSMDSAYGGISPGDTVGLELAVTFDSAAGNAYQADGVSIDVTWTAEQPEADA